MKSIADGTNDASSSDPLGFECFEVKLQQIKLTKQDIKSRFEHSSLKFEYFWSKYVVSRLLIKGEAIRIASTSHPFPPIVSQSYKKISHLKSSEK